MKQFLSAAEMEQVIADQWQSLQEIGRALRQGDLFDAQQVLLKWNRTESKDKATALVDLAMLKRVSAGSPGTGPPE